MIQLQILIVEDELPARERLISNLKRFGYKNFISCNNSDEAIIHINSMIPDLAIIDIGLKNSTMNGIELVNYVNKFLSIPIIYLTGFSDRETLIDAAKTNFSEYIVKPFTPQQLHVAIELALLKHPNFTAINENSFFHSVQELWLKQERSYYKLQLPEIIFIETKNKEIHLFCEDKKFAFPTSMKKFDQQKLSPFLVRIHKRFMVNLKKVEAFDLTDHQLILNYKGKEKLLPVGPDYRKEVYAQFTKLRT